MLAQERSKLHGMTTVIKDYGHSIRIGLKKNLFNSLNSAQFISTQLPIRQGNQNKRVRREDFFIYYIHMSDGKVSHLLH